MIQDIVKDVVDHHETYLFILTGPSASGKSMALQEMMKQGVKRLITTTSRPPRKNEQDGVDYYFRSLEAEHQYGYTYVKNHPTGYLAVQEFDGNVYALDMKEYQRMIGNPGVYAVILDQDGARSLKMFHCGFDTSSIYFQVDQKTAFKRMKRRDGIRKARRRLKADIEDGLYEIQWQNDYVLDNAGTKKQLLYNLENAMLAEVLRNRSFSFVA